MTDKVKMTDEFIMAYADGQLSEVEAREVEAAAAADAAIREKIRLFSETARQLRDAATEPPPVPDALAQRVTALLEADTARRDMGTREKVIPFRPRSWVAHWPAALAASITLAAGLATGVAIGPFGTSAEKSPFGVTALVDPDIADALNRVESGGSIVLKSGATLNMIASFADAEDTLCREFDYEAITGSSIVSVACHLDNTWHSKIAIVTNSDQSGDFAPASSLEALETWLMSSGLGETLDPTEEIKRLERVRLTK